MSLRTELLEKFAPFYMGTGCLTPKEMAGMALDCLAAHEPSDAEVDAASLGKTDYESMIQGSHGTHMWMRNDPRIRAALMAFLKRLGSP